VSANAVEEARQRLATVLKGTFQTPDTTSRPAVHGKKVVFIAAGLASTTSSIPAQTAQQVGKMLGWDVSVLDSQFNLANRPSLVRQAIAEKPDAIILNFDCPFAQAPLAEAKAMGIKIVPLGAFDCNDKSLGGAGAPSVFAGQYALGQGMTDASQLIEAYGAALADAMIVGTNGNAKVILATDPASTTLLYVNKGFTDRLATCGGCKVVATLEFHTADLGPVLQQKVATILQQHPEANAFRSPYSYATLLGIAPAIVQAGRQDSMYVVGGEGSAQDMDLIRNDKGLNACAAVDTVWGTWATMDLLNSLFRGEQPRLSGLGTMLIDKNHNLPMAGSFVQPIDFESAFKKAWGIAA
jgi:ribose transport system substrate-binding protein